jgi:hypothetical protein
MIMYETYYREKGVRLIMKQTFISQPNNERNSAYGYFMSYSSTSPPNTRYCEQQS